MIFQEKDNFKNMKILSKDLFHTCMLETIEIVILKSIEEAFICFIFDIHRQDQL